MRSDNPQPVTKVWTNIIVYANCMLAPFALLKGETNMSSTHVSDIKDHLLLVFHVQTFKKKKRKKEIAASILLHSVRQKKCLKYFVIAAVALSLMLSLKVMLHCSSDAPVPIQC